MDENGLTHVDLFSGIGGFALAAGRAGFRTVAFSEVDTYACRVLKRRWPDVPNVGDVRKRGSFTRFRGATVVTGGFPCQPWSIAGQRRGTADDRHLWPAMCEVIAELGAAWVIGENVPGIVGLGLEQVLHDLEALGYATQPIVVPACAVGTWHVRDRVWVLAHNQRERSSQRLAGSGLNGQGVPRIPDHCSPAPNGSQEWGALEWWATEPRVGRMVHGIPNRAHRLRGLGNAIVPQVAERFLTWIAQIENTHRVSAMSRLISTQNADVGHQV